MNNFIDNDKFRAKLLSNVKPNIIINGPEFENKIRVLTDNKVEPYQEQMKGYFLRNKEIISSDLSSLKAGKLSQEAVKKINFNTVNFVDSFMAVSWLDSYRVGVNDMQVAALNKGLSMKNIDLNKKAQVFTSNFRDTSIKNLVSSTKNSASMAANHFVNIEPITNETTFLNQITQLANITVKDTKALLNKRNIALTAGTALTLKATYDEAGQKALERPAGFALNETATFWNFGLFNVAKTIETGGAIMVATWMTAGDERVCPICDDLSEDVVELGKKFRSDVMLPPAHLGGCRCYLEYGLVGYFRLLDLGLV